MKRKKIIIIQARLGSTRLPGKILKKINGKSLLEILLMRLEAVKGIDGICVATTNNSEDDEVERYVVELGHTCFRGSSDDVLDRYYQCARSLGAETIIRVTSDCPLFSSDLLSSGIKTFIGSDFCYLSNVRPATYPDGLDFSIFSFDLLEKAWKSAKLNSEREHVVPWMWKNISKSGDGDFLATNIENDKDLSQMRWTVDEPEDFEYVKSIYKKLDYNFLTDWKTILRVLDTIPGLNSHIGRDEGLKKSEEEDEK